MKDILQETAKAIAANRHEAFAQMVRERILEVHYNLDDLRMDMVQTGTVVDMRSIRTRWFVLTAREYIRETSPGRGWLDLCKFAPYMDADMRCRLNVVLRSSAHTQHTHTSTMEGSE